MVVANGTAVVVEDEQDGIKETNRLLKELLSEISNSNEPMDKEVREAVEKYESGDKTGVISLEELRNE